MNHYNHSRRTISSYWHMPKVFLRRSPAVFTLEAAMLMAVILPVLLSIIYLGFLDHDRGVLQASACEAASLADNSAPDKDRSGTLKKYTEALGKTAVLSSKDLKSSFSLNKNFVQVSYTGSVKVPGVLPQFFRSDSLSSGRTCSRKLFHPADTIRKIRGIQYLTSSLKDAKDNTP